MLTLLVSGAWACPSTVESVTAAVEEATERYLSLDLSGFDEASAAALAEGGCLAQVASPELAAGIHRTAALRAWVARDAPGMMAALVAMQAAAPNATLDARLAPEGSRLHEVYGAARVEPVGRMAPLPGEGWVVDGRVDALLAPLDRATLVQHVDADGALDATWYFPVGADLEQLAPAALVEGPEAPAPVALNAVPSVGSPSFAPSASIPTAPTLPRRGAHLSRGLAIGSGAALVLGAAAFVAASVTRAEYLGPKQDSGSQEGLYALNVVSGAAGYGGLTTAVGLLVGAVVVHRW